MSRRELFGSLCVMLFLVNIARIVFAPLVQPVAADFGVAPASLGLVASATWLGSAASRLPTGFLLTRVARHRVVAATGALLVLTASFTALSPSVAHLSVGAFLMGLSSGMYFVAANPLISELFPDNVGRAIGIHGMSGQIAAVSAPLAVGAILVVGDWRTTFLCIAALAAFATVFVTVAAGRTTLPEAGIDDRSVLAAGRAQWRVILTGVAFLGTAGFLWNGLFNLYGDYLTVAKGIDPATGRLLLSVMFSAGVVAFFVSGQLADLLPKVPLLTGVVLLFVVGVVVLTVVERIVVLAAVSFVVGYAFFSIIPAIDTFVLTALPDDQRGSAYSIYSSSMMVVQALGSGTVGAAVVRGADYADVFRLIALGVGTVAVVLFLLYRAGRLPTAGDAPRASDPDPTTPAE